MNVNRKRTLPDDNTSSPEKKPKLAFYLEDNTPVRTIEVSHVPFDLNTHSEDNCKLYLRGYFERDGPVENVEIVRTTEKEWLAYVTFVVPDDAAKLICSKDIPGYCRSSQFTIKEADHAHQPKIDPNAVTLEQVNDHCLLLIMSHLPLIDAVNLGKASTRLQSASRLFYRKHSNFSFGSTTGDSSINETNLPVILEELGGQVCSIDWHSLNTVQFELLAKHCPNVTKIKLIGTSKDLSTVVLNRNKQFFANLKKLYIESSTYLYDGGLKTMISGRKLKNLELQKCLRVRGKFLNSLNRSKLKNVKIMDCPSMNDIKSFTIAEWKNKLITFAYDKCCSYIQLLELPSESLGLLKELHLDFSCYKGELQGLNLDGLKKVKKLTLTRHFQMKATNCNNLVNALVQINTLESLNIQGIKIDNYTIECLKSMKSLKQLRMDKVENTIGRNLYEMLRANLSTLEQLSISFSTPEILTGKLLFDLIVGMPKLNYFSHSSITWELLDVIIQAKPLQFFDARSFLKIGVSSVVFNDPKKVTFDANSNKGAVILSIHD